jgi:glutaredoxin
MNFTVYSKDNCPYCHKIKTVLELTNNNFVVYNLNKDFTKEEFYAEFGEGSTFPQVVCDNKRLGVVPKPLSFSRNNKWYNVRHK